MEVRPALPEDFEEIHPLLLRFENPRMSRDDWRRMLFDLPWTVEEPHRGYVLRDGGAVVGFLGTIFSRREVGGVVHRFCNLSSWIVLPEHRGASFQLVLPVLALRSHTIVNLSPSAVAWEVFTGLGFRPLETAQALLLPLPRPGEMLRRRGAVTTDPAEMRAELDEGGRRILADMSGTLAAQALLRAGRRRCHVVATRSPWKGRWGLAHVQYASDWDLLWERAAPVSGALGRVLGTVGLRVDARHRRGALPPVAVEKRLPRAHLYRPADAGPGPRSVDGLYTEVVGQRW